MSVVEYAVADRVARITPGNGMGFWEGYDLVESAEGHDAPREDAVPEGFAFQAQAAREGFKAAVKTRDAPYAAGS